MYKLYINSLKLFYFGVTPIRVSFYSLLLILCGAETCTFIIVRSIELLKYNFNN